MDASIIAETFDFETPAAPVDQAHRRLAGSTGIPIWFLIPIAAIVACCIGRLIYNLYKRWQLNQKEKDDEDRLITSPALPYDDWKLEEIASRHNTKDLSKKRDSHVDDFIHGITGSNWIEQWDSNHQCTYYWNKITHEVPSLSQVFIVHSSPHVTDVFFFIQTIFIIIIIIIIFSHLLL
jgi:hypothetical protein